MKAEFAAYKKLSCRDLYDAEACSIVLLRRGFLSVTVAGTEHLFAAPCILTLGDGLDVGPVSGYRHDKYTVRFKPSFICPKASSRKEYGQLEQSLCLPPLDPFDSKDRIGFSVSEEDMERVYSALFAAGSVKEGDRDGVLSHLIPALELIHRMRNELPRIPGRAAEGCVDAAFADICRNYRDKISLVTVSRTVRVNKTTVARAFREKTSYSVSDCIIAYRIKMANMLLSCTDLTVSRTASLCGFNSEAYFVKQYGARCGITPAQFRKKVRGEI